MSVNLQEATRAVDAVSDLLILADIAELVTDAETALVAEPGLH